MLPCSYASTSQCIWRSSVKQQRILVVGASGFVGKNLVLTIAKRKNIRILVRPTSNIELFKGNSRIEILHGNLETNQGIAEALRGVDIVIHCAAKTMGRSYWEFYNTNTLGTANLISAMHSQNVHKILYLSSHAVCGPCSSNTPRREHERPTPISFYGRTKKLAEDLIIKSGLSFTILRSVSVYGPHDKEILTYIKLLNSGICPIVGYGTKYVNLIYVQDLVDLIIRIVETDHFFNSIYFANDGQYYALDSIMDKIASALHKKNIKIRVPTFLALFIGLLNDVFVSADKKLVTRDKIRELSCQYWMCSSERVVKNMEFKPKYSFDRGIVETIHWYRKQGVLS